MITAPPQAVAVTLAAAAAQPAPGHAEGWWAGLGAASQLQQSKCKMLHILAGT